MEEEKSELMHDLELILKEKEENKWFENFEVSDEHIKKIFGLEKNDRIDQASIYMKIELEVKKNFELTLILQISNDYPFV